MAALLSGAGLLLVTGAWIHYLWLIPREEVPDRQVFHLVFLGLGTLLSLSGVARGLQTEATPWLALVGLILAGGLAGFFVYLLYLARLPAAPLAISVGKPLPHFVAGDDQHGRVDSREWRGQRVLLKFFRGHW